MNILKYLNCKTIRAKLNKEVPSNFLLKISNNFTIVSAILTLIIGIFTFWLMIKYGENKEMINRLEVLVKNSEKQDSLIQNQIQLLKAERDSMEIRWRQQIKPDFAIECDEYFWGGSEIEGFLVNDGKIATDIKVIENYNNGFNVNIPFKDLGEGMRKKIVINFKNQKDITNPEDVNLDITLSFKDASGTICYQRIAINKLIKTVGVSHVL
jgi:hypothetical protein